MTYEHRRKNFNGDYDCALHGRTDNRVEEKKMIKLENTEVFGWEAAIRGMRNPKNSWDKSDSVPNPGGLMAGIIFGANDLKLAKTLAKAGADHGKFLRYLTVQVDITAPFYWWKEFKTYRKHRRFMDDGDEFLDPEEFELHIETNSCSTMHKIHDKPFTLDDFSWEHLLNTGCDLFEREWDNGLFKTVVQPTGFLIEYIIPVLNKCREMYLETNDKEYWWQMIQLLPSSYNQLRTTQLNYQVLRRMYHARKNHKLDEWREFCKWIESLPYSELITEE